MYVSILDQWFGIREKMLLGSGGGKSNKNVNKYY